MEQIRNKDQEYIFVGFWKRVLASVLDLIILSPIMYFQMKKGIYYIENRIILPYLIYSTKTYCMRTHTSLDNKVFVMFFKYNEDYAEEW